MYNYKKFSNKEYDLVHTSGISVAETIPNFSFLTLAGVSENIFGYLDKPIILETGSLTCGMFAGQRDAMNKLADENPDFNFFLLYVREAHPGKIIPAHHSISNKCELANRLKAEDKIENRTIIIDKLDGEIHNILGALPNMVFIIDTDGKIMFKQDWNNANSLKKALQSFRKNAQPIVQKWSMLPIPKIEIEYQIFKRAGWDAAFDFIFSLPKLIYSHLLGGFCGRYPRYC